MRKLPPLKALRAFEAAARHMSFKAAADELGLTPTAISHQIRLLETALGGALFRRRPRPLTLTPPGAALFPVVRSGFDAIAEAFATVHSEVVPRRLEGIGRRGGMYRAQAASDEVGRSRNILPTASLRASPPICRASRARLSSLATPPSPTRARQSILGKSAAT